MSVAYLPRSAATELTITKGKKLSELLSDNGLDGQLDLVAQYNWGTKVPAEINRALVELVGCESLASDPLDSVVDPGRGTGGKIYKPQAWTKEVPTGKTYRAKVKQRLPAITAAITDLPFLFNPVSDTCTVKYTLAGDVSRGDQKDVEIHATGYYDIVKDEQGVGTTLVDKPSGTLSGDVKESHVIRKSEAGAPGDANYPWDGSSEASVGVLKQPAKITSVCAPYFVCVRYYKDATDQKAFLRMQPFYPQWNLTGKKKWEVDEKTLVVKWKLEGPDSSKAKLKHGQIQLYDKNGLLFFAPLTKAQITGDSDWGSSYDLVNAPIHWDKTKFVPENLPYRIQIQAHSDDEEDKGLALAVMPTQVPPYNYDQIQLVGFNVRNDTNDVGTEYLGDDSDDIDIAFRCNAMIQAIQLAKPKASTDRKILKVFVAPEFYYRGKKGAYAFENISTIVPKLREETDKYDYLDWVFVFGTALGSHGHSDSGSRTVHGEAIHYILIERIESATEITAKVWSDPKQGWNLITETEVKVIKAPPGAKGPPDPDEGWSLVRLKLDSTAGLAHTTDKTKACVIEPTMTIFETVGGSKLKPTNQIKVSSAICARIPVEPVSNQVITVGKQYWEVESEGTTKKITHVQYFGKGNYYLLTLDSPGVFKTGNSLLLHEPATVEIFNVALMQKGWHAPHLGDGLREVVTYKENISPIDFIRDKTLEFHDPTGVNRMVRVNGVNYMSALPTEGSKDIGGASPNVARRGDSAVGSEINKSGLGGGCIMMIDRVTFGMEVCLDHGNGRLFNFYTGDNVRLKDPKVQVHLIPSWGMTIGGCEPGKEVSALPAGLVFNVDGSRMESVARLWNAHYSCDTHIKIDKTVTGKCQHFQTTTHLGDLYYLCHKCAAKPTYYKGARCATHGAAKCNEPLQQMGKALTPSDKINVPLTNNANYFKKEGNVEVFPIQQLPDADVVVARPSLNGIVNGSAKPGFEVEITLSGTGLAELREVRVDGKGVYVLSITAVSDNSAKAKLWVARDAAIGSRKVTAHTFNGPSNGVLFQVITPAPPTLVSVTHSGVVYPSGACHRQVAYLHDLKLGGTNLQSVYEIKYNPADPYTYQVKKYSDPEIDMTIDVPRNAAHGPCTITVTSASGSATIVFQVDPRPLPTISLVAPDTWRQGTRPTVVVKGTNLWVTQSVAVSGGGVTATPTVDSDQQLTLAVDVSATATIGTEDLIVTTDSGATPPWFVNVTTKMPPALFNVTPSFCQQGLSYVLTLDGSKLMTSNVTISPPGVTIKSVQEVSDTQLKVAVEVDETAAPGNRTIRVTTAGGFATRILPVRARLKPIINSITQNSGSPGDTIPITFSVANLANFKDVGTTGPPGITIVIQQVTDDTVEVILTIDPTAVPGDRSLYVQNNGGWSAPVVFKVV